MSSTAMPRPGIEGIPTQTHPVNIEATLAALLGIAAAGEAAEASEAVALAVAGLAVVALGDSDGDQSTNYFGSRVGANVWPGSMPAASAQILF
jgi:hypothetical protein